MAFVCIECSVEFAWDESPSDDRCAQCGAAWAWIRGGDDQPLIRPDWHVIVCPDCGARLEMTTDDPRADCVGAGNPPGRAEVRLVSGAEVVDAEVVYELAVVDRSPAPPVDILDAELVEPPPYRSPLDPDPRTGRYPTSLRGGPVLDPAGVAAIAGRARARRPWWRRLTTQLPPGRPDVTAGPVDHHLTPREARP